MSNVHIFQNEHELGLSAAQLIFQGIVQAAANGRPYVLGCPGGRSARSTYQALGRLLTAQPISIAHMHILMMDEYAWQDAEGNFHNANVREHFSCVNFAFAEIFDVLNAGLPPELMLPRSQVLYPNAAEPNAYEERIQELGIDLFLLASGTSDGHVAFNGVGSAKETKTRVAALSLETRTDNLATFPLFACLDEVPVFGVTVGLRTIASAKSVLLLVHGKHKREAFSRVSQASSYEPAWPATIVAECSNATIFADTSAATLA